MTMTQRAIDGDYLYFVTANVQNGRWYFVTAERAAKLGQAIRTCCRMKGFDLLQYCILPNHMHMLVRKLSKGEVAGTNNAQRKLESMRCGTRNEPARNASTDVVRPSSETDANFLFSHRRLPSRRSLSKRHTLSDLMHSIKSTFSQTLRSGKFWHHGSYFRIVDSHEYLNNLTGYIRGNYTKMNLPDWYGQSPFVFIDPEAFRRLEN